MSVSVKSFRVTELEIPKQEHAFFGGSSAYTWVNCTGWHDLLQSIHTEPVSLGMDQAAREGSACHAVMEELAIAHTATVKRYSGPTGLPRQYSTPDLMPENFLGCKVKFEGRPDSTAVIITPNLLDYIRWTFFNVLPIIEFADRVFIERKVYLDKKRFGEMAYGYVDIAALRRLDNGRYRLTIVDYKFGWVHVNVDTPQLLYYGATTALEMARILNLSATDIQDLECVILQPKLNEYATAVHGMHEVAFFYSKALEAVDLALGGAGVLSAGNHCKYCKCATICPELRDSMITFPDSPAVGATGLTPEQLSGLMKRANMARIAASRFEAYCMGYIRNGGNIPGYKVVNTKNMLVWISRDQAEAELRARGIEDEQLYKAQLKTPREIMRDIPSIDLSDLTQQITQDQLAPVEDRRHEVKPALAASSFPEWEDVAS